ncbi:MAG: SDR family oxidoreductase [Verrucomicrobia bacterium]|nr:SDR family oxidoreductase [Verrucomicrobiota bacterium]
MAASAPARTGRPRSGRTTPLVLITGASQGIGADIALAFAREAGARLVLVARNAANLAKVATRAKKAGAKSADCFACDVTDAEAVDLLGSTVLARYGQPPDVLINNAGWFQPDALTQMEPAAFDAVLAANLHSAFYVTRALAPAMAKRKRGDLFFTASVASLRAFPQGGAYVAAKHGLLGLARAWREELRPKGIRVITVLPGATISPSWEGASVKPERLMASEDVAEVFVDAWRKSDRTVIEEIVLRPPLGDL